MLPGKQRMVPVPGRQKLLPTWICNSLGGKKELARFSVIGEQHVSFHFSRSPLKSKGLRLMSLEERMRHVLRWCNLWTVQILTAPVLARRRLRSLEDHQVFTNYRSTFRRFEGRIGFEGRG
jgi:hypothetical protein